MRKKREKIDILICASIPQTPTGMYNNLFCTAKALEKFGYSYRLLFNSSFENKFKPVILKYLSPYIICIKIIVLLLKGYKINFIEIHEPSAYFYCLMRAIFRFLPKCIVRSHGVEELFFNIQSRYYNFSIQTRILQKLRNFFNKLAFKLSDLNVVNNSNDRNFIKERYKVNHNIISTISIPTVDTNKNACLDKPKVLFVGTFFGRREKGFCLLKEIIPLTLKQNNEILFIFAGVGLDGAIEISKRLSEFRDHIAIIERYNSYTDLVNYVEEFNILLCPSFYESLSLAVLEGMALKLAVICSENCFGIKDLAIPNEEVIFIDPSDVNGYVDKIIWLAKDAEKRKEIANRGYELIRRHTWEKALQEYSMYLKTGLFINRGQHTTAIKLSKNKIWKN